MGHTEMSRPRSGEGMDMGAKIEASHEIAEHQENSSDKALPTPDIENEARHDATLKSLK